MKKQPNKSTLVIAVLVAGVGIALLFPVVNWIVPVGLTLYYLIGLVVDKYRGGRTNPQEGGDPDEQRLATLKRRRKWAEQIQGALIWTFAIMFFGWLVTIALNP